MQIPVNDMIDLAYEYYLVSCRAALDIDLSWINCFANDLKRNIYLNHMTVQSCIIPEKNGMISTDNP